MKGTSKDGTLLPPARLVALSVSAVATAVEAGAQSATTSSKT